MRPRVPRLVAAGQARRHIRELLDGGMSRRRIAKEAGVSATTIRMILGQGCGGCTQSRRIHPDEAGAILAVRLPYPRPGAGERKPAAWTDTDDTVGVLPEEFVGSLRNIAWQKRGNCASPEIPTRVFFPYRGDRESLDAAKAICEGCPVKARCLQYGLDTASHGVWGGL